MEKTQNEDFYLAKAPIKKLLVKFSIPCVLAMLVSALYSIVDQIFIGMKLSEPGIYASTVVHPFTVLALAIALLIGDGCAALFSVALGEKDTKTGNKSVAQSISASAIIGVVLALIGLVLKEPILQLCGCTPDAHALAVEYYNIILIGLPFYIITSALSSIIRADGSPKYSMMATLIGAIVNLILDPIMILGLNWGMTGAALATIIGQIASAIVSLVYFRKTKIMKLNKESFKPSFKVFGRVCRLGISSFITQIAIVIVIIVSNTVIRAINDPELGVSGPGSVLGVVFKIYGIVIAFAVGVSVGGQPIIGYNYGAKNYKRVFETFKYILFVNFIVGVIATILFMACPIIFAKMFSISDYLLDFAAKSFRIYLGGILLCCIQKGCSIFLQSINRPYKSMICSLMRDVILLIPGICILGLCFGLEAFLWAGIVTDVLALAFTAVVVFVEYRKLMKSYNVSVEEMQETIVSEPLLTTENFNYAITIDREFGSGGKYIAQELAKRLNIKCYDNEILTELAKNTNVDIETLEKIDENEKSSFWYGFATNIVFANGNSVASADDELFLAQSKIIENINKKAPCVIVGRCSDVVLKSNPKCISIFVYSSDKDFKVERKMKFENTSREETIKNVENIDKYRANYYNRFTGRVWGNRENYEISLDTSKTGVEEAVNILENYIKQRLNIK